MPDADSVSLNKDNLSVAHLEQVLGSVPEHYGLHLEDNEGNVFVVDHVSLNIGEQFVDFHLKRVTREEQEEIARDLGIDTSFLD